MNWPAILDHRRQVLHALIAARQHAIYAGDRPVAGALVGFIIRQRGRVQYAQKMAAREPRCFTPVNERFASPDNPAENAASVRG